MRITDTSTEEFGVQVTSISEKSKETFYVQLTDNEYRPDLGCWITTETSDGDIDQDNYPEFDFNEIVEAAEKHATKDFEDKFEEQEIPFHCAINSQSIYMRIERSSGEVELVIGDDSYGSYQSRYIETGICFDSKKEALEYADKFRTGDYQDCTGLYRLLMKLNDHYA